MTTMIRYRLRPSAVEAARYLADRINPSDAPCICGAYDHAPGSCLDRVCTWCGEGESPLRGSVQDSGLHGVICSVEDAESRSWCPYCGRAGQLADLESPCDECGHTGRCAICSGSMDGSEQYPTACSEACRVEQHLQND